MLNRLAYYKTDVLSPREEEVYGLILKGFGKSEIATQLSISVGTAITHFQVIFAKKHVNSQRELMARRIQELEKVVDELSRTTDRTRKENDTMLSR